jgi:hypothetical protein
MDEGERCDASRLARSRDSQSFRDGHRAAKAEMRRSSIPAASAKASQPPDEALLGDGTGALPYAEEKALRETFLARKAKLDFEIQAGKLLAEDAVKREWSSILGNLKSGMLAVPSRCGARLGHLTAGDIAEIDAEVRSVLAELGGGHVAR